jgi:hypothetical protein
MNLACDGFGWSSVGFGLDFWTFTASGGLFVVLFFFQVGIGPCRLQNTHRISVQMRKLSMLSRMPS